LEELASNGAVALTAASEARSTQAALKVATGEHLAEVSATESAAASVAAVAASIISSQSMQAALNGAVALTAAS
jgi:hypothetical protein